MDNKNQIYLSFSGDRYNKEEYTRGRDYGVRCAILGRVAREDLSQVLTVE